MGDICPSFCLSVLNSFTLQIKLWWPKCNAVGKLHELSTAPGAVTGMWDAMFSKVFKAAVAGGYKPLQSYIVASSGRRHASVEGDSALRSNHPICVLGSWLQECFGEAARIAVQTHFTQDNTCTDCQFHVSRNYDRNSDIITYSRSFTCSDHAIDHDDEWELYSYPDAVTMPGREGYEPTAKRMAFSEQVIAITGDWYSGGKGCLGDVEGDRVIDESSLD